MIPGKPPLTDDVDFERRQRFFQRFGWVFIIAFVVAAACGVFGSGAYSSRTKTGRNFWIQYDRVLHRQAPENIRIHVSKAEADQPLTVRINTGFIEKISIEKIIPEPSTSQLTEDGVLWSFSMKGSGSADVHLTLQPKTPGSVRTVMEIDGEPISLQQIILP
jgi:hypothetical protein